MGVKLFPAATGLVSGRYLSHTVLSSPDGLPVAGASGMPGLHLSIAGGIHGADFCTAVADVVPTASSDARTLSPNASPGGDSAVDFLLRPKGRGFLGPRGLVVQGRFPLMASSP